MRQHIYDLTTGLFSGVAFETSIEEPVALAAFLATHTPPGCALLAAEDIDYRAQRVDPATGALADYQPPSPGDSYEWDAAARRWVIKADIRARAALRSATLEKIADLENSQHRAIREAMLSPAGASLARLAAIETEIETLRLNL